MTQSRTNMLNEGQQFKYDEGDFQKKFGGGLQEALEPRTLEDGGATLHYDPEIFDKWAWRQIGAPIELLKRRVTQLEKNNDDKDNKIALLENQFDTLEKKIAQLEKNSIKGKILGGLAGFSVKELIEQIIGSLRIRANSSANR